MKALKSFFLYFLAFVCLNVTINLYHLHFNDSIEYRNPLIFFLLIPLILGSLLSFLSNDNAQSSGLNNRNLTLNLILITAISFALTKIKRNDYCDFEFTSILNDQFLIDSLQKKPIYIASMESTSKQYIDNPLKVQNIEITSQDGVLQLKKTIAEWLKASHFSYEDIIIVYDDNKFDDNKKELQIILKSVDKKLLHNDPYINGIFLCNDRKINFSLSSLPVNCQKK